MTSEKKQPTGMKKQYKQIYFRGSRYKPYTEAQVGLDDYLHTSVWLELRNRRLKKDLYRCVECGTGINLNVHHIRYPDVWGMEDIDNDLVTLCDSCHSRTHQSDIANDIPF